MVKKLKEKEMQRTSSKQNDAKETPAIPAQEPTPTPIQEPKPTPKPTPKQQPEPQPKAQEATPKPVPTPAPAQPVNPSKPVASGEKVATAGIYIQVASVSRKTPDAAYLASLAKKGYDYKLYRTQINNQEITKILVGPFNNNNDAKDALPKVKQDLASGAFIFRVP